MSLSSKATTATVHNIVRVCAGPLSFFCPKTKACLILALTGKTPAPRRPSDGITVSSIAGVTLIPHIPINAADTLMTVRKKVADILLDFPADSTVFYHEVEREADAEDAIGASIAAGGGEGSIAAAEGGGSSIAAGGGGGKRLRELPGVGDPGEDDYTAARLVEIGKVFVIRFTPHNMKQTALKTESDRCDIACPRCERKGPTRYTGKDYCVACKECAMCCVAYTRCGADHGVQPCVTGARADERIATVLAEFYKWQRGIMRPY